MKKIIAIILFILIFSFSAYATCNYWSGNTYTCLSTDTKPEAANGSRLYTLDTKRQYIRVSGVWNEIINFPDQSSANGKYLKSTGTEGAEMWDSPSGAGDVICASVGGDLTCVANNFTIGSSANLNLFRNTLSTGLLSGGAGSINADTTKFDIAAGTGIIVDHTTTPGTPIITSVTWSAKTAVTDTYLSTDPRTYIFIDSSGNVVQQDTPATSENIRQYIYIGRSLHQTKTTITKFVNEPALVADVGGYLHDLYLALGAINVEGNVFSANGNNLYLNRSAGKTFRLNANAVTSLLSPNITTDNAATPQSIRYEYRDATAGDYIISSATYSVDPNYWDNGTGTLAAVGAGEYTVQRVYLSAQSNGTPNIYVFYGQAVYNSLAEAISSITSENFIKDPSAKEYTRRAFLIVQQATTDLSSADNAILDGDASGGGGGGGSMVYPGAGVPNSTGSAWGTSYTVGTSASNLVQLNGSSQLPAVSAALLTSFPTLNQNTTGTAAGLTAAYIDWSAGSGGAFIQNKPTLGTMAALNNPLTTAGDIWIGGTSGAPARLADVAVGSVLISGGVGVAPSWTSTPTFSAATLSSFPTFNQDTTGMAGSLKSPASTGKTTITGPAAGTTRAKTVRDADDTVLELGGSYTPSGTWNWGSASVTWPTFNQNTTGSAAKWTTARNLAGNSVDGSAAVAFSNAFIVKGTADAGLSGAQFLGALGTGIVKNTTSTGVLSIAAAGTDYQAPLTNPLVAGTLSTGYYCTKNATDNTIDCNTQYPTASALSAAYTDWNASSGGAFIQNKPTLGTAAALNKTTGTGTYAPAVASATPTDGCASWSSGALTSLGSACGTGGGYATIQDEGAGQTQRTILNFTGAGVSCADDTTRTTCTIAGGGASTFDGIGSGTNTTAAMVVGAGASLTRTSTGSISASEISGTSGSSTVTVDAANSQNGLLKATSGTVAAATSGTDYGPPTSGNATGLVISTTTTGAHTAYTGTSCTNQFPRSLSAIGAATCASVANDDVTSLSGSKITTEDATTTAIGKSTPSTVVANICNAGSTDTCNTFRIGAHTHQNATGSGGTLDTAAIGSGVLAGARGGIGVALPTCTGNDKLTANGSQVSCATDQTSGGITVAKTTAVTTNSTTTPANITGLSWSVAATTNYAFDCVVTHIGTATGGPRFNLNGPAGATLVNVKFTRATSTSANTISTFTAFSAAAQTAAVTSGGVATAVTSQFSGIIQNGATAGTAQFMLTSSTAGQSTSVYAGSTCVVY
jgi:hypothetical protein